MKPIIINTPEEYLSFSERYSGYVNSLEPYERTRLGSIQASQKYDNERIFYEQMDRALNETPPLPYDVIAWRAGNMYEQNRTFMSASFFMDYAKAHEKNHNLHKIILKKGSRIFPLIALGEEWGESTGEIIINNRRLKRKFVFWGSYIYE